MKGREVMMATKWPNDPRVFERTLTRGREGGAGWWSSKEARADRERQGRKG